MDGATIVIFIVSLVVLLAVRRLKVRRLGKVAEPVVVVLAGLVGLLLGGN